MVHEAFIADGRDRQTAGKATLTWVNELRCIPAYGVGASTVNTGSSMNAKRLIGVALLVVGLILLFMGYQSSQGWDDQISETLTGEYTDSTMWYWITGGVASAIGLILVAIKG
ncbi:MAG: DUF3185 family protein [Wenzhouxiangella sp.]